MYKFKNSRHKELQHNLPNSGSNDITGHLCWDNDSC